MIDEGPETNACQPVRAAQSLRTPPLFGRCTQGRVHAASSAASPSPDDFGSNPGNLRMLSYLPLDLPPSPPAASWETARPTERMLWSGDWPKEQRNSTKQWYSCDAAPHKRARPEWIVPSRQPKLWWPNCNNRAGNANVYKYLTLGAFEQS